MGGEHGVAFADADDLGWELGEEGAELVLVDLARREPVASPGHPGCRHDPVAVAGVVDPAVLVLGLGEATVLGTVNTVVAGHLVDVDRVPQPLDGFDLGGCGRPSELDVHDRSVADSGDASPATLPGNVRYRLVAWGSRLRAR